MKRSGFKQLSYSDSLKKRMESNDKAILKYKNSTDVLMLNAFKTPLKRSRLKKASKDSISKIQRLLWAECRRIALKEQANNNGEVDCYTCPAKNLIGSNRQLGHVPYPKSTLGAFLKYALRLLKWQCFSCNINKGGMGAEAYKRLLKENGEEFMKQLELDRRTTVKAYDFYVTLLETYRHL